MRILAMKLEVEKTSNSAITGVEFTLMILVRAIHRANTRSKQTLKATIQWHARGTFLWLINLIVIRTYTNIQRSHAPYEIFAFSIRMKSHRAVLFSSFANAFECRPHVLHAACI